MYRGWTKIDYEDKHCFTDQTDKETLDDRGRDGRTSFTWRIKEQATRLTPLSSMMMMIIISLLNIIFFFTMFA
jgi:hypothetical protein